MALSVGGLGSGMDIDGLIKNLMAVESRPLYQLQQKEALLQQKVSAVGQVKSAVSEFQSAVKALQDSGKFVSYKGSTSSEDHVGISASSKAPTGSFSVKVQQLAQEQKLASGNFTSAKSAITGAAESKLTFSSAADPSKPPKSVTIPANATLEDIRDAVNKADVGVNASIVNDGSGYKLVYSSKNTGTQNTIKVQASDDALNQVATHGKDGNPLLAADGKPMLTEVQAAKDAKFLLDGIEVIKQSNTVTDAIDGVTLTLKKLHKDEEPARLSVSKDTSGIKTSLEGLVEGYNKLMKALKDVSSVNLEATPKPGEQRPAGVLNGASIIRTIQSQIRSAFNEGGDNGGIYTMASQFGLSFNQDGTMKLDDKVLDKALEKNADDIAKFFATDAITSDSGISYVGGSSKTQAGEYEIVITQLLNGTKEAGKAPVSLDQQADETFTLKVDGKGVDVTLPKKTYASAAELAHAIESGVNEKLGKDGKVSVTVDPDSGKLAIQSGKTGKESSVELVSGLEFAGFTAGAGIPGGDSVAGTIGGHPAKGDGNKLVGAVGSPVEGLTIAVNGGVTGNRGTVSFTKGFAFDLDQKLEGLVKKDGAIDAFSTGLSESAKGLTKQQEAMELRLVETEKRYKQQFSAMDALLAQYNNMSNFLTQQLAGLSGSR
ncbi:flagellar filament capping protein FliD [Craterilacuibacter sinensis]|uniref:Flagellar hook-associated protein 2 n=1 Tax=Craterilacuibacter sinensis TaxID=2686017 RepID=A0A845BGK2_9NEIS|nr:flagellar filament capping protein FliD [Craterilacuibacter sinensis]MXR35425.1 flagellar filament capping protein FliD [Craterilacuibacter sinensis]